MNSDPVRVSQIDWYRVLPPLQLLRATRLGFRLHILFPAFLAVAVLADFGATTLWQPAFSLSQPFDALHGCLRFGLMAFDGKPVVSSSLMSRIFVLLWISVIMLSIMRSAASDFCSRQRTGFINSIRFSCRHCLQLLTSTALVLAACTIFTLAPRTIAILFSNLPVLSEVVGVAWLISKVIGVLVVLVALPAWLLSIAAIAANRDTGADALSRGVCYTLSHKLYGFVLLICSLFIAGCAAGLAEFIIDLAFRYQPPANGKAVAFVVRRFPPAVFVATFSSAIVICYVILREREDGSRFSEFEE